MLRSPSDTINKTTQKLIKQALAKAMTYSDYRLLVSNLANERLSTGPVQTEALSNYTILSDRRMKRWDKTLKLGEDISRKLFNIKTPISFLVLTESWCGDAAPSLPIMNKIAEVSPKIDLKIILRDKNLDLMNLFLTNDAMSIPKLIILNATSKEVLGEWGPRPSIATRMALENKAANGVLKPEFKEKLQIWYNRDKGQDILNDLMELLPLE